MFLSLCPLIPRLALGCLFVIPWLHILGWSAFIALLKRNQKRVMLALKEADLIGIQPEMPRGTHFLTFRILFWQMPLLAIGLAILWLPQTDVIVAGSIVACIVVGIVQTLRVTGNLIVSRVQI